MNKHDLNVFTYGYLPLTYWKNWLYNIKQFFRNIKYAYQRAIKGYCDLDIWNLDNYYTCLIRDSIDQLANTTYSFPGDNTEEGKTYEDWVQYLKRISVLMDMSIDRSFEEHQYYINEFEDEYSKYLETKHCEIEELPDGCCRLIDLSTPEQKKLQEKYFKEEKRIYKLRTKDRNKALDMIKARWDNLWD